MVKTLFRDARVFDGWTDGLRDGCAVLVADGAIQEISETVLKATGDIDVIDCAGRVLMPVREELRRGASHIEIMGSGGVSTLTDPIDRCQYSDEEILAAVDEASIEAVAHIAATAS
ncbi:MAG: hypothetical protein BGO51_23305 [Rhodospirillales bacterium 69-11]|jgi:imidazolonepropionase-like amidohydrolase|nr:MAG: hypothetical protein BGO51_23305 [Rhodospirillales bacterium 69-11]